MNAATLMVTNACNFRCSYCFGIHKNVFMTEQTARKATDELKKLGVRAVSFFGGEPLLAWDTVVYVIEYAKKINYFPSFGLITNGYLLDKDKLHYIKKNKVSLAVSFDGIQRNEKRVLASGNDTTARVFDNLMLCRTLNVNIDVCPVINRDKIKGLADDFIQLYKLGFTKISSALNDRDAWRKEDFCHLYNEYEAVLDFIYHEQNSGKRLFFEDFSDIIEHTLFCNLCPSCCKFGTDNFIIDADGKIYPCVQFTDNSENSVGDIESGIDRTAIELLCKRYSVPVFDSCSDCKYKWYCHSNCACRNYSAQKGYSTEATCAFIDMKMNLVDNLIKKWGLRERYGR